MKAVRRVRIENALGVGREEFVSENDGIENEIRVKAVRRCCPRVGIDVSE